MKKERFLPYEMDYTILGRCRKYENLGIWMISIISIVIPLINEYFANNTSISLIVEFLDFILIVAYYILNTVTEVFLYPATARKRRKGFIDNSLGSKYLEKEVEGYYSNDGINKGPFKIIVNCGENCYFTYNIAKTMLPGILIKNSIFIILFLTMAYFGFAGNSLFLPILQIMLSSLFLTELIHHISFVVKLGQLFDRFKEAFSNINNEETLQKSILLLLDYETILAYNKAPLSDKIYKKTSKKLSAEWENIKIRYDVCKK